jgi:hypothetical protein
MDGCSKMPTTIDPWAFGLNHLLTIIGFLLTLGITAAGFRTFSKWKREKIEERRIDIALEALALAYEASFIFESIRSPMSFEGEWFEMKGIEASEKRQAAGPFFATLRRIDHHKDYFERVWKMQPRFMAVFGKEAANIFIKVHQARRKVEVSAQMLMRAAARGEPYGDAKFRDKLENDIWDMDESRDEIKPKINEFVAGIEKHCFPVVVHRYAKT